MAKDDAGQRERILDAALRVFAREGYHKASIRRIAEAAKLNSPPLIYWYFKDKSTLFQSVMLERIAPVGELEALPRMQDAAPEVVLKRVALSYLGAFDGDSARRLFRLFISEAARTPESSEYLMRSGVLKVKGFLVDYFGHQVELGRFKRHDPEISARSFIGTMIGYLLSRELFPPLREDLPEVEAYVDQTVCTFIEGLKAEGGEDDGGH